MGFSGHQARKRFGQHWLRDASVLAAIVEAADLRAEDRVLEVGPGRGALTERLLASAAEAIQAIELDRDLVDGLTARFSADPRFHLRQGDVLETSLAPDVAWPRKSWPTFLQHHRPIARTADWAPRWSRGSALSAAGAAGAEEVAERIRARPGHGSFSA